MDSTPQSPNPNLTRTGSPATSTPERTGSPMKGLAFSKAATPAQAETSTILAKGENGLWDDDDVGSTAKDQSSRARRELSVIEETSLAQGHGDSGSEAEDEGALAEADRPDTEDELDEADDEELVEPTEEGGNHVPDSKLGRGDSSERVKT